MSNQKLDQEKGVHSQVRTTDSIDRLFYCRTLPHHRLVDPSGCREVSMNRLLKKNNRLARRVITAHCVAAIVFGLILTSMGAAPNSHEISIPHMIMVMLTVTSITSIGCSLMFVAASFRKHSNRIEDSDPYSFKLYYVSPKKVRLLPRYK